MLHAGHDEQKFFLGVGSMSRSVSRSCALTLRSVMIGWLLMSMTLPAHIHRANAAEMRWRAEPPRGVIVDEELTTVLQKLADQHDVKAVISPDLEGRVTMNFGGLTADQIMDELSRSFGFDWFYDGRVVYFFPIGSIGHQVVSLGATTAVELTAVLSDLELMDDRYPIVESPKADVVLVTGPPQYITLIEQTLDAMKTKEGAKPEDARAHQPSTPKSQAPGLPRVHYGYAAD